MAKYKKEVTEYVLDRVNIADIIGQHVDLKRAGRNLKGLCPFHGEKTPSFVVSDERQHYHCFGCGASGNAIGYVMQKENMGFLDALEYIADRYSINIQQFLEANNLQRELDTKPMYDVMRLAALFYYRNLGSATEAKAYFEQRGVSAAILKQFGLGYAAKGWDHLYKHLKSQGISDALMLQCGLVVAKEQGGYYDRFRDRVMFPIFDLRGRVVAFGGRVLDEGHPKYLNSPESKIFYKSQTLYGLNVARKHSDAKKRMIVVEGYMDAIALHQNGFSNTVATLGTAMTELHAKELKKLVDEVLFAYDSDEAGQKAIARSLSVLREAGLRIKVVNMGDCKDPDEFIKRHGAQAFTTSLENAMNTIDFSLKRLMGTFDLEDDEQRLSFLKDAYAFIAELNSQAEQDIYIENLAKRTAISAGALHEDYQRYLLGLKHAAETKRKHAPTEGKDASLIVGSGHGPNSTRVPKDATAPTRGIATPTLSLGNVNTNTHTKLDSSFEDGMPEGEDLDDEALADLMWQMSEDPDMSEIDSSLHFSQTNLEQRPPQFNQVVKNTKSDLPSDDKLVTIEKAVLKCTLVSKAFYARVVQRMQWEFQFAIHRRDFEAIKAFYAEYDDFDPISAVELLPLDLVERLKDVSIDSTQVTTVNDVDKLLGFHYKHLCEAKLKAIDEELAQLKLKPGPHAALELREKMVLRQGISKELSEAMKAMRAMP